MAAAPEVFLLDDDDQLHLLLDEPGPDLREKVELAARNCPKRAISVEGS